MECEDISEFNEFISGYADSFIKAVKYEQVEEMIKEINEVYEQSVDIL